MRALVLLAVAAALVVTLVARGTHGQDESSADSPVVHEQDHAPALAAEDMERLRQERRALLERESPPGDEGDPVEALRRGQRD
jgi:hypothetical protein